MSNTDVRQYAREKAVYFWQIAACMGISEPTMTRRLRFELSARDKQEFFRIIDKLADVPQK